MGALPTKYDKVLKGKEKVNISIQYSGKWGSKIFFREAKDFLKRQEFGRYITVKGIEDVNDTGNFEIRLQHPWKICQEKKEPIEVLLHSKKTRKRRGDWLLRTDLEKRALVTKIDEILLEPHPSR